MTQTSKLSEKDLKEIISKHVRNNTALTAANVKSITFVTVAGLMTATVEVSND